MTTYSIATNALESVFAHQHKIQNSRAAAVYYVQLISSFPTVFDKIKQNARIYKGVTSKSLSKGRMELLEKGFIAQVVISHQIDRNQPKDFGREQYIPVDPIIIWENYKKYINSISKKQMQKKTENQKGIIEKNKNKEEKPEYKFDEDELTFNEKKIGDLEKIYKTNFGKYGIVLEEGSVTLLYNSHWLYYNMINNIEHNDCVFFMLSGLGSFEPLFREYYEKMLDEGLSFKILFDKKDDKSIKRIKNIQDLKKIYPNQIEIRHTQVSYATSRRIICDVMGVDGRKLLPQERKESDIKDLSSYVGTIYLQEEDIKYLRKHFCSTWKSSLPDDSEEESN